MIQPGTTDPVYEKTPPQIRKPLSSSSTQMVPRGPRLAEASSYLLVSLFLLSHTSWESYLGQGQYKSRYVCCGVIRIMLRTVIRILEEKKSLCEWMIPKANNYKIYLFQTHGRPFILQVTCYSFHLCWDETTSQKVKGILQLMPELSVERMQSWISNHGSTIDSTNTY